MILRKLRLQRGWSQEHVAELTDLSVRTIQRIERGGKPSLESAQALAAVCEVDLTTYQPTTGATLMSDQQQLKATSTEPNNEPQTVTTEEKAAINYVKGIKEFRGHLFMFIVFMVAFLVTGKFSHPQLGTDFHCIINIPISIGYCIYCITTPANIIGVFNGHGYELLFRNGISSKHTGCNEFDRKRSSLEICMCGILTVTCITVSKIPGPICGIVLRMVLKLYDTIYLYNGVVD